MSKKPWQKLEEDLNAVEAMFADPTFRGKFDMKDFGQHEPDNHLPTEHNFCGTQGCLAGWLGMLGKNGYKAEWTGDAANGFELIPVHRSRSWIKMAEDVYGMTDWDADTLFYNNMNFSLQEKIAEAREVMQRLKEEDPA